MQPLRDFNPMLRRFKYPIPISATVRLAGVSLLAMLGATLTVLPACAAQGLLSSAIAGTTDDKGGRHNEPLLPLPAATQLNPDKVKLGRL
ncbi:MAG: hypothetical protein HGA47_03810, partial [Zoogloea sp.]|nr:hypothetical protein [Zoogloea sp.]